MPHRYDAAVKTLVEQYPEDWLRSLGVPVEGPVTLKEADLSTVSANADKLLFVEQPEPTLVNLELQASRDDDLPYRLLVYASLILHQHRLKLLGLVVLLRRAADSPVLTGTVGYEATLGGRLDYQYRVVRVWEESPDWALQGGLGLIPLAPLTRITQSELPGVLQQMKTRLAGEPAPVQNTLWATTYVLMGLRYPASITERVAREVGTMKESATYQAILEEGREEGRVEEAGRMLLNWGTRRFGVPNEETEKRIKALTLEQLHELSPRLLDVESWEELLAALVGRRIAMPWGWTHILQDSVTYQAMVEAYNKGFAEGRREGFEEGRKEYAQRILLVWGERRFGSPDASVVPRLGELSLEQLRALQLRVLEVESWDELLAG